MHITVSRGQREELNHAACREWMGQEITVLRKQLDTVRQIDVMEFLSYGPLNLQKDTKQKGDGVERGS